MWLAPSRHVMFVRTWICESAACRALVRNTWPSNVQLLGWSVKLGCDAHTPPLQRPPSPPSARPAQDFCMPWVPCMVALLVVSSVVGIVRCVRTCALVTLCPLEATLWLPVFVASLSVASCTCLPACAQEWFDTLDGRHWLDLAARSTVEGLHNAVKVARARQEVLKKRMRGMAGAHAFVVYAIHARRSL
jgi:hypothetical protein